MTSLSGGGAIPRIAPKARDAWGTDLWRVRTEGECGDSSSRVAGLGMTGSIMVVAGGERWRDPHPSGSWMEAPTRPLRVRMGHPIVRAIRKVQRLRPATYTTSVIFSVSLDMVAVRSSLSQAKGLPSMARLMVRKRTTEKTWR